ncbi:hypothetical protein VF21_10302, partial [Pseudogymnoascus sp. 05NY08]
MESTEQNADYSVIQNHPQTSIETDAAIPSDAHSGEAVEILGPSRSLPGVIDLTAQPDSIQFIGEDTRITQLRALYKTFRDIRQNSFLSSATISNELLDMLPLMMEGAVQYVGQLRVENKQLQERTNWFEAENKKLYRNADTLQSNFNYIEHALENMKATSRGLEKAVVKELRRNEFLKIENTRLEKQLRDVMSAKRGSTERSDNDEPRRPGSFGWRLNGWKIMGWGINGWKIMGWGINGWAIIGWKINGWKINGWAIIGWKINGWAIIGWGDHWVTWKIVGSQNIKLRGSHLSSKYAP